MKYQKELSALQEYIDNFDPAEFTSSVDAVQLLTRRTPEQMDHVRRLKAKMQRKRQCADTFHQLVEQETAVSEVIITQAEVDALLEGWSSQQ